jgi:hypothetical protein
VCRYVEKSKDRQAQGKLKERIVQEQRAIEAERTAFLQESDETLNELLTQYWQLRKEAGEYSPLVLPQKDCTRSMGAC